MQKWGLPWWLHGKESWCNAEDTEMQVQSLGQEDPLEEGTATHLPGELHRQRILMSDCPWDCKESDATELAC